jgi:hypothetical protein
MSRQENIGWLCDRSKVSLGIEPKDPADLIDWLETRRKDAPFLAELIPLREVGYRQPTATFTMRRASSFASRASEFEVRLPAFQLLDIVTGRAFFTFRGRAR